MQADAIEQPPRPATLMLHLIGKCNLRCVHCYMEGAPERQEQLPLGPVLAAIADCRTLGVGSLYITGGEPLLYPGLSEVLDAAAADSGLRTTVSSNATQLKAQHAEALAQRGFELNVSVDGTAGHHDAFRRQRGAFARTERGVKLAAAAGVRITIVMTVCKANLSTVETVAAWAFAAGAKTIRFQPLLRLGRGSGIADERLGASEIDTLVMHVSDLASRYRGRMACAIVGQSHRFMLAHPCAAYVCNGGGCHRRVAREVKKIVVRENGTILPEATNLDPRFAIGHIGDGSLPALITRFLDEDYGRFDALCRRTYHAVLPDWRAAVVPWDEILAESSRHESCVSAAPAVATACGTASPAACGPATSREPSTLAL
jgi:MoaA/NifB/PqqE/SkfB family radical SAM enzyme